jgi:acetylornithine/N-succinyldiaminopimelate aminotransferase
VALDALQDLEAEAMMGTYARAPVEFVRGRGTVLWDSEGHEYLDFLSGISVAQLGHCPPSVVEAIREQAGRLIHVGNLFYTEPAMRLAKRLKDCSLGGKVFLSNSGAEAIECAIKLARRRKPGGDFVVLEGGFHGRTMGALSATPQETKQAPFAPLVPGFVAVPREGPPLPLVDAVSDRTAAVIIEPIQGECGIHPIHPQMLAAARDACDDHGALLIFDEIQCGMGRTGLLWAWEHSGVAPDVMTVAKGLGGGLPIGACVTTPEHADVLQLGDHGSTFAGGPVIATAANAVLELIDDNAFLAAVAEKGDRLAAGLADRGLEVRGLGLMLAFRASDAPELVRRALLEERLVLNATGPDTVRLLPPLTVSDEEIDEAVRSPSSGPSSVPGARRRAAVRLWEQSRLRGGGAGGALPRARHAAQLRPRADAALDPVGRRRDRHRALAGRGGVGRRLRRSGGGLGGARSQGGRGLRLPPPGGGGGSGRQATDGRDV